MKLDAKSISDSSAVQALSKVAKEWLANRGIEAYVVVDGAKRAAFENYQSLPSWVTGTPAVSMESGRFARQMLAALLEAEDEEVATWAKQAIAEVSVAKAQVDPVTLAIGGAILIGAILAARVKKIGRAEFYEGVPKELANVLKAGTAIAVPK